MSFEIVRAKKLFCQELIWFLLSHHPVLVDIDDISRNLLKYLFVSLYAPMAAMQSTNHNIC